ncbi:MAG: serine--tRNA ligase [Candidatus Bathyarchaeota archaeon]|nr:MAG: serine--tRNA ligase [Candidatus Bathyarchaeota archaeon]
MLDIRLIRDSYKAVRENLGRRHDPEKLALLDRLVEDDARWRELTGVVNDLRRRRNEISAEIARVMKEGGDALSLREEAGKIPRQIVDAETERDLYGGRVRDALMQLPNLLHESVPYGVDESDNEEIRSVGKPPAFDFEPKSHAEIAVGLGIMDLERAAKVSGSGFYYLKNELALLDYSIMRYAIDHLMGKGFVLVEPPYMLRRKPYEGVTDLGDFEDVMYKVEGEDLYLIATSEHAMGAMFMDEVLNAEGLPIRFCGVSPCFRKEIGTHGKYTKGLFRVHRFNKVEQFIFSLPEQSWGLHEELQRNCEELYQELGIYYRVVNVCTGDIGSIASKKYDVEIWMADGEFREVGSNSNCTDYQARRLNIRYRMKEGQAPVGFVHTLNNTALATSRTMVAILEQYQQEDGSVVVPEALRPYMNGIEVIKGALNPLIN